MMVNGSKGEILKSRVDSVNQLWQDSDGKLDDVHEMWKKVHCRCVKMKRVTSTLANILFVNDVLREQKKFGISQRSIIL